MPGMMRVLLYLVVCLMALGSMGTLSAATLHVYLLTGQSNSLGAVKGSPASDELLQRYASHQWMWNGNMMRDTGVCFEKNPSWSPVVPQVPAYAGGLCMGPEYGFVSMMERLGHQTSEGDAVAVIKASLDGGGNTYWVKGKPAYESLLRTACSALQEAKGLGDCQNVRLEGLLYLQGESDSKAEVLQARKRLVELVRNLKADLKKAGFRSEDLRLVVLGQPANWNGWETEAEGKTTATELQALASRQKGYGWVYTRDLTKITSGDAMGVHYDGKSQLTIGARFACAATLLQGRTVGAVRGDKPGVSLHEPSAWWGGKLPGQRVAVWNVSSAREIQRLSSPLSLEGIRVEDPFEASLVIAAEEGAKKSSAVLSLGAGGVELRDADLELQTPVKLTAGQVWKIPGGRALSLGREGGRVRLAGRVSLAVQGGGTCLLRHVVLDGVMVKVKDDGTSLAMEDGELRAGCRVAGAAVQLRGRNRVVLSEEEVLWEDSDAAVPVFRTKKLPGASVVQGGLELELEEGLLRRVREMGKDEFLLVFDGAGKEQSRAVDFSGVTECRLTGSSRGKGEISVAEEGTLRVRLHP